MKEIEENKYQSEINRLTNLLEALNPSIDLNQKLTILKQQSQVVDFLESQKNFANLLFSFESENIYLVLCLLALGQGNVIFHQWQNVKETKKAFAKLLTVLKQVEVFYHPIGGMIGYHLTILRLILSNEQPTKNDKNSSIRYYKPHGLDLRHATPEAKLAVRWGIEELPVLAEIYAVGGAGDRLNLIDETTGEPLPAAQLRFFGHPLLEHLIMDLQAKEYLYYKCFNKQVLTPIAMMTSKEKNNDFHIHSMCAQFNWFGRPPDSFFLFTQPLVPVISKEGTWCASSPFHLVLKPGGHGVIWKLLKDNQVFEWFEKLGRKYALVRQINNVAAGIDTGIPALTGWGIHFGKVFGFASCLRRLNAAEGMNILIEKAHQDDGYDYCITNVEYTEFAKKSVYDVPVIPGSRYSLFPANTNILFADLKAVSETVEKQPIPGMIINMKTKTKTLTPHGTHEYVEACRLESTMQNIADYFVDHSPKKIEKEEHQALKTFVTYNKRFKTIVVTKKEYVEGHSPHETPVGAFHELLHNFYDLLHDECHFHIPRLPPEKDFMKAPPPFIIRFHPAIGPLYKIISQKIHHGHIAKKSEWQMDIAEAFIENLNLDGSLLISAKNVMGHFTTDGYLQYSHNGGKCYLKNVKIQNLGINHEAENIYWKNQISRFESFKIVLEGNAEFFAENVTFTGNYDLTIPENHKMTAKMIDGQVVFELSKISGPTWYWEYSFDENNDIKTRLAPQLALEPKQAW